MLPDIGDIKRRRAGLGLTQKKLALISGVSQSIIAKIESDKINPSYSVTKKIFEVLEGLEKKEETKAGDVMSTKVLSAKPADKVSKTLKLMSGRGFSQLPVFDKSHCVGSISEKAVIDELNSGEKMSDIRDERTADIMTDPFPLVNRGTPFTVLASLLSHNFAVLISERDRIVGIVTKADLLKSAKK